MLDIKLIREDALKINELLKRRNPELSIDAIVEIDKIRRKVQTKADELRSQRKSTSQQIGMLKKKGEDTSSIESEVKKIGEEIKELEEQENELNTKQRDALLHIPNTPDESTPIGSDESENVVIETIGVPKSSPTKPHWEVIEEKKLVDFERGVKIAQSRFSLYTGKGAALERALINFFLDIHTQEHGYTEIIPPLLVNSNAMVGTGQLPKFADDMYKSEEEDLYLIPTAEVPVTNIFANEILKAEDLPKYMVAYTPCFRREAGSAGKDTRGLIRLHQFNKVELVKLCTPETAQEEHEKLTHNAQKMLELLELPYRKVELCTADIGFSAKKCYDLEVWMPSYNDYKEISSCSNFGDYQARRANIKYRDQNGKPQFVHTVNGSGLAVGRTFAAIIENCQLDDGSIAIPENLKKYTHFDKI